MERCDYLIVGGGIAGASAGYGLSRHGSVIVAEREDQPGYHTTGRSAAFFVESYGNEFIRPLTHASRSFFDHPPAGFTDVPLLRDRGAIYIADAGQIDSLERFIDELPAGTEGRRLDAAEIHDRVPVLKPGRVVAGYIETDARDIDVNALHQGFLKGIAGNGGRIACSCELLGLKRQGERWRADTTTGVIEARVVINAAGAWADDVARLAGAKPLGLTPMRRTVIVFPAPDGIDISAWPLVIDIDETCYFKPESGAILASPADETPMAACDVQADELDIAITVDRIEQATTLKVRRLDSKWAGLRTFAPDRTPVVGWDPAMSGFFWFAGQGGYGIQTAPAMSRLIRDLLVDGRVGDDLAAAGVRAQSYQPARFP